MSLYYVKINSWASFFACVKLSAYRPFQTCLPSIRRLVKKGGLRSPVLNPRPSLILRYCQFRLKIPHCTGRKFPPTPMLVIRDAHGGSHRPKNGTTTLGLSHFVRTFSSEKTRFRRRVASSSITRCFFPWNWSGGFALARFAEAKLIIYITAE
jgi:hypothetical protein